MTIQHIAVEIFCFDYLFIFTVAILRKVWNSLKNCGFDPGGGILTIVYFLASLFQDKLPQ